MISERIRIKNKRFASPSARHMPAAAAAPARELRATTKCGYRCAQSMQLSVGMLLCSRANAA
eukprot:517127-Prymnesium_polylepis.1